MHLSSRPGRCRSYRSESFAGKNNLLLDVYLRLRVRVTEMEMEMKWAGVHMVTGEEMRKNARKKRGSTMSMEESMQGTITRKEYGVEHRWRNGREYTKRWIL